MRKIKIQSILAAIAGLLLATSCSSSFLDTDPTDATAVTVLHALHRKPVGVISGRWVLPGV